MLTVPRTVLLFHNTYHTVINFKTTSLKSCASTHRAGRRQPSSAFPGQLGLHSNGCGAESLAVTQQPLKIAPRETRRHPSAAPACILQCPGQASPTPSVPAGWLSHAIWSLGTQCPATRSPRAKGTGLLAAHGSRRSWSSPVKQPLVQMVSQRQPKADAQKGERRWSRGRVHEYRTKGRGSHPARGRWEGIPFAQVMRCLYRNMDSGSA